MKINEIAKESVGLLHLVLDGSISEDLAKKRGKALLDELVGAGAGVRSVRLAETDEQVEEAAVEEVAIEEQTPEPEAEVEEQEQEPTENETVEEEKPANLNANAADALLAESNLPDASRSRLAETEWPDEGALTDAIASEVAYVAQLTGAGRPVGQQAPAKQAGEEKSREELLREKLDDVDRRHGVFRGKEEV